VQLSIFEGASRAWEDLVQLTSTIKDKVLRQEAATRMTEEAYMILLARRFGIFKLEIEQALESGRVLAASTAHSVDAETRHEAAYIVASIRMQHDNPTAGTSASTAKVAYCSKFIQPGGCNDKNCRFPHKAKKEIPCSFLAKGACLKGNSCDWKH